MKGINNMKKNILKLVGLMGAVLILTLVSHNAKGNSAVLTLTGVNSNNLVFTGPAHLFNISIYSNAGTNGLLNFYDSPYGTNTYIVGAFTNLTRAVATTNITYTNVFGVISTNSYSIIQFTTNTLAAGARARPLLASATTISNAVISLDFEGVY